MADLVTLMKTERAKLKAEMRETAKITDPIVHVTQSNIEANIKADDFDLDVKLQIPSMEESEIQYFKDAISEIDEIKLKEAVERQSLNKKTPWVELTDRKSMMCGSHYDSSHKRRIVELPSWLNSLARQFDGFFDATKPVNHVLINKYEARGGIAHHTDGPGYLDTVAILSLGGPALLSFEERLKPKKLDKNKLVSCTVWSCSPALCSRILRFRILVPPSWRPSWE